MMKAGFTLGAAAVALISVMLTPRHAVAQASGPSFDCAKATSAAEKMICADAKLSALDRQLQTIYKAAVAKAKDAPARALPIEQRGWIKGRDECWKAKPGVPMFLTANWTVDTQASCMVAQYQLRIAELQAVWQLLPPEGPIFYHCGGSPANEVVVTYFKSELPSARFERGDRTATAYLTPANGGKTYEGQNMSFQRNGRALTAKIYNVNTSQEESLTCQAR